MKVGAVSRLDNPLSTRIDRVEGGHVRIMGQTPLTYKKNKQTDKEEKETSIKLHNKLYFFCNRPLKFPFSREKSLMRKLQGVIL